MKGLTPGPVGAAGESEAVFGMVVLKAGGLFRALSNAFFQKTDCDEVFLCCHSSDDDTSC